jgi:hypothetical protein
MVQACKRVELVAFNLRPQCACLAVFSLHVMLHHELAWYRLPGGEEGGRGSSSIKRAVAWLKNALKISTFLSFCFRDKAPSA